MVGFWAYKFALDEDLCSLSYKNYFESIDDFYPSMSMCFRNPFQHSVERNTTQNEYEMFLKKYLNGNLDFQILDIDASNPTFDLSEYLVEYWVMWRNGSDKSYSPKDYLWKKPEISFTGFWSGKFYKCFSFETPDTSIQEVSVLLKNTIFPESKRPRRWGFLILLHYPNQLILPSTSKKHIWPRQTSSSDYEIRIYAENLEIFLRRKQCHPDWTNYDNEVKQHHIDRIGCRPFYLESDQKLPICTKKDTAMETASILSLDANHEFPPPCKAIEKINYKHEINDLSGTAWDSKGHFWVTLIMQDIRFKVTIKINISFDAYKLNVFVQL